MPSFHSCKLDHHILKIVNGTYQYNFSSPVFAGTIEMVSDATQTAAFGRLGQIVRFVMSFRLNMRYLDFKMLRQSSDSIWHGHFKS